jgi:2'-5' RNA ligase
MARLFVAADLQSWTKDRLLAVRPAAAAFPGVRLVGREELHLTLHFLGEVEDDRIAAVRQALEGVNAAAFTIDLEGVGRFPPEGDSRVLWAGVRPSQGLAGLHGAIAAVLADAIGFRPEARPYHPHVTLARLDVVPPAGAVEDYLDEQAAFQVPAVPISSFSLCSSVLAPAGPRYGVEATFELCEAGPSLHLVYLRGGKMLLTKKTYRDWREIQDEHSDYMASKGPWSEAELIDFLDIEYPDLAPVADRVRSFILSAAEALVL